MTDKQINRWLRRRFTQVGWALVLYYLILNILAALAMYLDMAKQLLWAFAAGDYRMDIDMVAVAGNAWGYILTIVVGFVILYAWKGGDYFRSELLVKENPMTPAVFFCLLSFCVGSQMVNSLWIGILEGILNQFDRSVLPMLESVSGTCDTFSMFLYSAILAPIAEEVLFRGYVLRSLRPFGKRFAIFGSALLFGLFHGNLLQTPYAFLMGLVLGYGAAEYSIIWAVVLHMFNNLVLADLLTRLTAGLSDTAYSAVNLLIFGGFALISLVILVKNRKEIRAYHRAEWMDRRCLKCFFTNSGILVLMAVTLITILMLLFI